MRFGADFTAGAVVNAAGVGVSGGLVPLGAYGPTNPIYIAHRGGALMYPENTTEGLAASFLASNRVLEVDVQLLSDSALGVMHDTTVDRTTTSVGNVSSFNSATWAGLAIDANTWHGSNFGNALVPPLFPAIVSAYKGRATLVPEAKAAGTGAAIVTAFQSAGVPTSQAMVQSFTAAELASAVVAGYPAMYLSATGSDMATAQAAGATWAGLNESISDATFTSWIAGGFKTTAYSVNNRYRRDQLLALGVSGFFSDDPQYLKQSLPIASTDNFVAQTWQPGMLATDRGKFYAPDYWGWDLNGGASSFALQGWACPLKGDANVTSFTMDFKVTFVSANAGDATRWASVFLTKNDKPFTDGVAPTVDQQGFHLLMRKSGDMQIFKRSTATNSLVANVPTVAIADGEEVAYRIVATPTAISLHRLNGSGAITHTATVSDSDVAFRGGYMFLNRNGLAVKFRDISIV